jgi:glutathione synthase/RimK-type ligase-like ATP-grasp enzyme
VTNTDGVPIDLSRCGAAIYRQTRPCTAAQGIVDDRLRSYVEQEAQRFLLDLFATLDCFWFPASPERLHRAQNKLLQLELARQIGFSTPPTLVTNDPDAFLEFWRAHSGRVVTKVASEVFHSVLGHRLARYTEPVQPRQVARYRSIGLCPTLFQGLVDKVLELRVTVVGSEVFTAAIHSQQSNRTRHDWRRYDHHRTRYSVFDLPREVQCRCVALVERLGLVYGAIDLVLTPDGEFVFLEINPAGQYGWVEGRCDLPISDAICSLVSAHAVDHGLRECDDAL